MRRKTAQNLSDKLKSLGRDKIIETIGYAIMQHGTQKDKDLLTEMAISAVILDLKSTETRLREVRQELWDTAAELEGLRKRHNRLIKRKRISKKKP